MELYIDNRQDQVDIDEAMMELFREAIRQALLMEKASTDFEISLSIVDNREIQELNRDYRGIDSCTDVLSFPLGDDFGPQPMLGDIIVSAEKALEQAEEYGHSFRREMTYLIVHSMFHLMGYDHMEEEEKRLMRKKEKGVMKKIEI